MTASDPFAPLVRLTPLQPEDLNPLLDPFDADPRQQGQDLAPCPKPTALPWPGLARPDTVAVGVLVDSPLPDPAEAAFRLTTLATEQDVAVIALSSLDYCGLERFVIRTERIAGQTEAERAQCRDQVMQFRGLEVVVQT
jgi:hypothetical protein